MISDAKKIFLDTVKIRFFLFCRKNFFLVAGSFFLVAGSFFLTTRKKILGQGKISSGKKKKCFVTTVHQEKQFLARKHFCERRKSNRSKYRYPHPFLIFFITESNKNAAEKDT